MKESYWGYWLIVLGVFVITVLLLIQNVTSQNTHDYYAVKEITQAAMIDAIDYSYMEEYGEVRISKEVFIESFLERFSQTASLSNTYKIKFYDIYEVPPKVSLKITSGSNSFRIVGDAEDFDIVNKIDAVLEVENNSFQGSEAVAKCTNCIRVTNKKITEMVDGYTLPGSEVKGYTVDILNPTNQWFDFVVEGDDNSKCKSIYALFNKTNEQGIEADSIGYDTYTCRLYEKNGNPKKSCSVVMPSIAKSRGNVKGWKIKGTNQIYAIGQTVNISQNTIFVPVFEAPAENTIALQSGATNTIGVAPSNSLVSNNGCPVNSKQISAVFHSTDKNGNKVVGLKSVEKSSSNCCGTENGHICPSNNGLYLSKVTVEKGYVFKGWAYYENGNDDLIGSGLAGTSVRLGQNNKGTVYNFYPIIEEEGYGMCSNDDNGNPINFTLGEELSGMRGTPMVNTKLYTGADFSSSKTSLVPGNQFIIRGSVNTNKGEAWVVYYPITHECGYIDSNYAAISLRDYLKDLVLFNMMNTASAQYRLSKNGTHVDIKGVTGIPLYSSEYDNFVPLTYSFAKVVKKAAEIAKADGRTLELNDAYRPNSVTKYIYTMTKNNVNGSDIASHQTWFLAQNVSGHNTGCAVDITINGSIMPSPMHALSMSALKYNTNGICFNSSSNCTNHVASNFAPTMTSDAKKLDSYFRKAIGISDGTSFNKNTDVFDLPSEWWHYQSNSCHQRILSVSPTGASFWANSL